MSILVLNFFEFTVPFDVLFQILKLICLRKCFLKKPTFKQGGKQYDEWEKSAIVEFKLGLDLTVLIFACYYVLYPLYFLFNSRHIFYHHTDNPKNDHHCEICDKYFFCLSDLKIHTNRSSLISESFSFVQNMCQFTILSTIHFSIMNLLLHYYRGPVRIFEGTSCLKIYYIYVL